MLDRNQAAAIAITARCGWHKKQQREQAICKHSQEPAREADMAAAAAAEGKSIDHEAVVQLTALENRLFRLQRKSSDAATGVATKLVQRVSSRSDSSC